MIKTMDCDAVRVGLSPYLDGELDSAERKAFERHLAECEACRAAAAEARAMSRTLRAEVVRERAPASLAARLQAALGEGESRAAARRWYWSAPALVAASLALVVLGAAFGLWTLPPAMESAANDAAARDAVAAHVRALVSERVIDVASSDRHTVKPWFEGRVELAPPVEDLTGDGYRLVGGRVDFIGGRRVAALVYRHRLHVVTLFVGPTVVESAGRPAGHGYHLIHWNQNGMSFWAVSDLEGEELERFAAILRGRIGVR